MSQDAIIMDIMTLKIRKKKTVQVEFRKVNASGIFIAQAEANQKNSMSLLRQNGFRPLTYQEALVKINQNPELKAQLKGKWFYLSGKGLQLSGYYTFDKKGELTQGKEEIEKTVYVWKGSRPLSLFVHVDEFARRDQRRFSLDAVDGPSCVTGTVVGVRDGQKVAAPEIEASNGAKIDPKLVSEFKSVVTKIDSATQAGILSAEIAKVVKKVIRTIE